MPPSNLGIVFGPNLLRQVEVISSLAVLANMSYQAKAVEIMVAHAHDVSQEGREGERERECVHPSPLFSPPQIFHIPEEQIKQLEMEYEDGEAFTTEVRELLARNWYLLLLLPLPPSFSDLLMILFQLWRE